MVNLSPENFQYGSPQNSATHATKPGFQIQPHTSITTLHANIAYSPIASKSSIP